MGSRLFPQKAQIEGVDLEGWRCNGRVVGKSRAELVCAIVQDEHFESFLDRVHEPAMLDTMFGVDGELLKAVEVCGRGGKDFAEPVGGTVELGVVSSMG